MIQILRSVLALPLPLVAFVLLLLVRAIGGSPLLSKGTLS